MYILSRYLGGNLSHINWKTLLHERSREGFDILYKTYSATLYGIVNCIVEDKESANRLLHDVFAEVWEQAATYNENRVFFTWLIGITRTVIIRYVRSHKGEEAEAILKGIRENARKRLDQLLKVGSIRESHCDALYMIFYSGQSYEEAARTMNVSSEKMRTDLRQGLRIITARN